MKRILVTGATGQISSYLIEFLLDKNLEVHGLLRRASTNNTERIQHLLNNKNFILHYGDLSDMSSLMLVIQNSKPDEIYNLAAQSHVKISNDMPLFTADVVGLGALRLLECIKQYNKDIKFLQMSSSEMFGGLPGTQPQSETTPFHPRSPYGVSKLFAYFTTINYRESFNLFASNSITFNSESPKRGEDFVTRKITKSVANIIKGNQDKIILGNLSAYRDWMDCRDTVEGLWLILQHSVADDFVLGSAETHSVREFCQKAFAYVDINIVFDGEGLNEKGYDSKTGKCLIEVSPEFFRPAEVNILLSNPEKANKILGWKPKISFNQLIENMVKHDLE